MPPAAFSPEMTKSSGRIPRMPASVRRLSPASYDRNSTDDSGIRFIGGAPMKDATKVVAGFW